MNPSKITTTVGLNSKCGVYFMGNLIRPETFKPKGSIGQHYVLVGTITHPLKKKDGHCYGDIKCHPDSVLLVTLIVVCS